MWTVGVSGGGSTERLPPWRLRSTASMTSWSYWPVLRCPQMAGFDPSTEAPPRQSSTLLKMALVQEF